jgi:hypothetical protein
MEPNSPWFLHPERYGLTLRHRTLRDFYQAHRQPTMALGYDLPTLTEQELLSLHEDMFLPLSAEERAALRRHHEGAQRTYDQVRNHS